MPPLSVSLGSSMPRKSSNVPKSKSESDSRKAPVIPMTADPALTDIQQPVPRGLLHAQRPPPKEDVTGAWDQSHQVSDDRTRLPDYRKYEDARIEGKEDADYEEIDETEEGEETDEVDKEENDEASFVSLPDQKSVAEEIQTCSFDDFTLVTTAYLGFVEDEEGEQPAALTNSVFRWGGTLGRWAKDARARVDPKAGRGNQRAQALAGALVNDLVEATHERRPTKVISYPPFMRQRRYELLHPIRCQPDVLKPSVFQPPPSGKSPASPIEEPDVDERHFED